MKQKTLAESVEVGGVGLHTGAEVCMKILPAPPGTGRRFRRTDVPDTPEISTRDLCDLSLSRRTTLGKDDTRVQTVEHVLATLYGLGIHNAVVELDGPELPAGDGSAKEFVAAVNAVGTVEQEAPAAVFAVTEPIAVSSDNAHMVALPSNNGLRVSYTLEHDGIPLGTGFVSVVVTGSSFVSEIAPARTFCFKSEVAALLAEGFGKGASDANTLIIDDDGVVNNELRFEDEPVRHKILDLLGDLCLLGFDLRAHIYAVRSGHRMNRELVMKLQERSRRSAAMRRAGCQGGGEMDNSKIRQVLPHRYPFLLVDKVLELEKGKRVVALKNVSENDQFFQGHFPGRPIMPGVLQIEALAQAAGVLLMDYVPDESSMAALVGMESVRFRRAVVPGDRLVLTVTVGKIRPKRKLAIVNGVATVEGEKAAEAKLIFSLLDVSGGETGTGKQPDRAR